MKNAYLNGYDNITPEGALKLLKEEGNDLFQHFPEDIRKDFKVVQFVVGLSGLELKYAHAHLQDNATIAFKAISENQQAFDYISDRLKNDKLFVLQLIPIYPMLIKDLSPNLKSDKEIATLAINKDRETFLFLDQSLKSDKEIVLLAVSKLGRLLKYTELKNDKDVVLTAIKNSGGFALEFASLDLKNDKEIVLAAVKLRARSFDFAGWYLKQEVGQTDPQMYLESYFFHESMQDKIPQKQEVTKNKMKI